MDEPLKLLCIFAHPDDETLYPGGVLPKYSAEGVETYLLTATRGERGWAGRPEDNPGLTRLGEIREAELRSAAKVLGIQEVAFLDYIDGKVDQAEPQEIINKIALHLRRIRPQVVVTFDPLGIYGHPDHIAVAQFTLSAVVAAASPSLTADGSLTPHIVSKLYYVAETRLMTDAYHAVVSNGSFPVDGVERMATGWPNWGVSARIDISAYWDRVVQALACHHTQFPDVSGFASLAKQYDTPIWGERTFYRAFSQVNGGRETETDLFDGLRK